MPSVLPRSRDPIIQVGDQPEKPPARITSAPSIIRRAEARIRAMAISAVSSVRTPGVLVTIMPLFAAA
jgi:hypothetical protein